MLKRLFEGAQKKIRSLTFKMSALTMVGKMVLLTTVFAVVPMATSAKAPVYESAISFQQDQAMPIVLSQNNVQIETGQSLFDEEQSQIKTWVNINGKMRPGESVSHRDPAKFRPIYQAAAEQFGIPWQLIEAVHEIETGKSDSTANRSYAGAMGPMQFMPGTWRAYQIDGNGDGVADITDVVDAIYTGAHYLARSGADAGRIDDALFNYNHSMAYVHKVKTIAYEIGLPK